MKHSKFPHPGISSSSMMHLLIGVAVLVIGYPILASLDFATRFRRICLSIICILSLLAVGKKKNIFIIGSIILSVSVLGNWINEFRPDIVDDRTTLFCSLIPIIFVINNMFRYLLHAPKVTHEVLYGAIAIYLLLAVGWAFAYMIISAHSPGAFSVLGAPYTDQLRFDTAEYFSFITLLSVGYGDIVPITPGARTLAFLEGLTGCFFMTVFIARLVAQYSSEKSLVSDDKTY